VVIEPDTGAVRAMVGISNYDAPDSGQNNILTTLRHPGSALKPFVYAVAIENGESPASLALASLAQWLDTTTPPYARTRNHALS